MSSSKPRPLFESNCFETDPCLNIGDSETEHFTNKVLEEKVNGKKKMVEKSPSTIGRWTLIEHERFLEAYKLYGKNWKLVEKYVGTRSATQARSHAQKYFYKLEKIQENKIDTPAEIIIPAIPQIFKLDEENYIRDSQTPSITLSPKRHLEYSKSSKKQQKIKAKVTNEGVKPIFQNTLVNSLSEKNSVEEWKSTNQNFIPIYPIPTMVDECSMDSWERELNIQDFQMRHNNSSTQQPEFIPCSNDEESVENTGAIIKISQSVASMFE